MYIHTLLFWNNTCINHFDMKSELSVLINFVEKANTEIIFSHFGLSSNSFCESLNNLYPLTSPLSWNCMHMFCKSSLRFFINSQHCMIINSASFITGNRLSSQYSWNWLAMQWACNMVLTSCRWWRVFPSQMLHTSSSILQTDDVANWNLPKFRLAM